jgi:DNA-binding transcriptional MocR family regulator
MNLLTADRHRDDVRTSARRPIDAGIDPFAASYSCAAHAMIPSEIRSLFAVAARPEVISLAGGMPCVSALPLDLVGDMASQLIGGNGSAALQYCTAQGDPGLREMICEVMKLEGITAHPDDVVVTVGSQQALDLIARIFTDPGDVVLVEGPSYVGALGVFAAYQADVIHVPMDDDGLIPESLEEVIRRLAVLGKRAKFLYTVPNFHNPAGVTLSRQRRGRILDICASAGLPIIEDNPYGLLGFAGDVMRALRADDPCGVVYLGTFSKTFAPGVRVGWALAPPAVRDKLVLAAESAVLCHSNLAQLLVREYFHLQPWAEQIKVFREVYRERRDAMLDALGTVMPGSCQWTTPAGGFYVWLRLPDGIDSRAMLPRAVSAHVAYVPGTGFYSDGSGQHYMRLSYCLPTPDRIREGVRRLARVIESEPALQAVCRRARDGGRGTADAPVSAQPILCGHELTQHAQGPHAHRADASEGYPHPLGHFGVVGAIIAHELPDELLIARRELGQRGRDDRAVVAFDGVVVGNGQGPVARALGPGLGGEPVALRFQRDADGFPARRDREP